MKSLKEKEIVYESDMIGKKIVDIELFDTYPMGYIILEGGEYIAFTDDCDGIEHLSMKAIEQKLYYSDNLLDIFLKHGCISQEYYDNVISLREERAKKKKESIEEQEYKRYLELKAKFEKQV